MRGDLALEEVLSIEKVEERNINPFYGTQGWVFFFLSSVVPLSSLDLHTHSLVPLLHYKDDASQDEVLSFSPCHCLGEVMNMKKTMN